MLTQQATPIRPSSISPAAIRQMPPASTPSRGIERSPLAQAMQMMGAVMSFPRNSEIFGENEPADYVYRVISGSVRTYKILNDGRRQVGGFYLAGDIFGLEFAEEHTFSAEAVSDAKVVVVKRSAISTLSSRDPAIGGELFALTGRELRRAQEHAMQARPYAQMLINVLESLVRRTDIYNVHTGKILHPLLIEREEKNVLVIVIAGDKGFAGGFNSNVGKAAQRFIDARVAKGQNVDLEPIGKKAIAFYKRKYPAANYEKTEEHYDNDLATHFETIRHRAGQIEVAAEHPDLLVKTDVKAVSDLAHSIIERYERSEIDAVYLIYNEFKSVVAQKLNQQGAHLFGLFLLHPMPSPVEKMESHHLRAGAALHFFDRARRLIHAPIAFTGDILRRHIDRAA